MVEKADAPAAPEVPVQFLSKVPKKKPGRVEAGKKLAERNRVASAVKKEP